MAKQKNRQSFWAGMDERERMYFVLALCCAALLLTVIAAFFIVRGGSPSAGKDGDLAVSTPAPMVMESGYNKDQNTIDTAQYTTTILEESPDAGQSYLNETLFLGDSNTARMYRVFDYCTYDNAIGSVGMSARSLASYACVQFKGYSGYKTMPEAVALMQPRRVILTFGTNDLDPGYSASSFAENYAAGIRAIVQAYPSVDIIVNAIPPLGQQHSNSRLTQSQLDEYNQALVEMCQENDWKFLNSAEEVLKDADTGYARSGYVESSDGIHLTSAAMDALFDYIRTHSYITEDDRPALTTVPAHTGDKDVSVMPTVAATPQPTPQQESTPEPDPTATPTPTPTPSPTPTATPGLTYWEEVIQPTCTEQGYTIFHCNEDPEKDYKDLYVNPTGHNYVNGVCTNCGAQDPAYGPTQPPAETPVPEAPVDPASSDPSADHGGAEDGAAQDTAPQSETMPG